MKVLKTIVEYDGKEIELRPKRGIMNAHKDDCLWSGCPVNVSTLEAVYWGAEIRCCEDEDCKAFAIKLAAGAGSVFLGSLKNALH